MGFHARLSESTRTDQDELFRIPFVRNAIAGEVSVAAYVAFLSQAYHHVKHTVPLLMATGTRIGHRLPWLQAAICEYIEEERGHEAWILNDLATLHVDPDDVREGSAGFPCELMVSYAYDQVQRLNPMSFFGMVHVLEGTSARGASQAADAIRERHGLPAGAFSYLTSHGTLDQAHVRFFEELMDRVTEPSDQDAIVHSAHAFFRLYGDIFRNLPA